eukprot:358167-Chlamydomonas_euryale.AAC.2
MSDVSHVHSHLSGMGPALACKPRGPQWRKGEVHARDAQMHAPQAMHGCWRLAARHTVHGGGLLARLARPHHGRTSEVSCSIDDTLPPLTTTTLTVCVADLVPSFRVQDAGCKVGKRQPRNSHYTRGGVQVR